MEISGIRDTRGVDILAGETVTLAASAARTADGNSGAIPMPRRARWIVVNPITVSGGAAGDVLDVYVDVNLDGGTTWWNAIHFTQQAGNGAARTEFAVLDPANPGTSVVNVTSNAAAGAVRPALFGAYWRARWTIVDAGAHGQTHTFSVSAYGV